MTQQVLDYSVGRPGAAAIKNAGYIGVMRYVAPPFDAAKIITAKEYDELRAAGLMVGLNWEWYGNRAREGAAAGLADARQALQQADALGYHGAIYFSVDYDAPLSDQARLNAYFQSVAQVIGLERTGAYAGYWPLKRLFDANLITYGWQTIAWSAGKVDGRAHLYQKKFRLFGGDADASDVLKDNWLGTTLSPEEEKVSCQSAGAGTCKPCAGGAPSNNGNGCPLITEECVVFNNDGTVYDAPVSPGLLNGVCVSHTYANAHKVAATTFNPLGGVLPDWLLNPDWKRVLKVVGGVIGLAVGLLAIFWPQAEGVISKVAEAAAL